MSELEKQFDQLKSWYQNLVKESETIIEQMRENLKQRTSNEKFIYESKTYSINLGSVEDLYVIDGLLRRQGSSNSMTKVAEEQRGKNPKANKYSPENPYY